VQVTLQGEYVQLAIGDTGIGIAASEIPEFLTVFIGDAQQLAKTRVRVWV
jgi:signal transduction histidine kinase